MNDKIYTKSGIMLGLGETEKELLEVGYTSGQVQQMQGSGFAVRLYVRCLGTVCMKLKSCRISS
ncbi:MAG: hypothetical protein PHV32_13635 [Eubacteriales bacterium]|nr:hypothetical protein [Eubacteriales bacterium]